MRQSFYDGIWDVETRKKTLEAFRDKVPVFQKQFDNFLFNFKEIKNINDRAIQTVVIQIHSNDVMMLLWLNEWIIINVFRLDSLEKMSWGRDVSEFE